MWYAIVRNQQIGPVSTGAIAELIRVGVANAQTYAWAEGMGDWKPLSELPDFAPLLGGSVLDAPGGGRDADEHASTLMMSSDQAQAWAEVLTHLPELANSAAAAQHAAAEDPNSTGFTDIPDASLGEEGAFEDGRTVLEMPGLIPELDHLRQQQGEAPPPTQAMSEAPPLQQPLPGPPSLPPEDSPALVGPADWDPVTRAEVPAIAPEQAPEEESGGSGKLILILVALVILGAGGAVGVKVMMADGGGGDATVVAEKPLLDSGPKVVTAVTGLPPDGGPAVAASADAGAAEGADAGAAEGADAQAPSADAEIPDAEIPDAAAPDAEVKVAKVDPPKSEKPSKRPKAGKKHNKVKKPDPPKKPVAKKDPPKNDVPIILSRNIIQSTMGPNKAKLKACSTPDGPQGVVNVQVVIQRSGQVSMARVTTASFRGTPVGKCIEKTVKGIKFPEFTGEPMNIPLPPLEI